MNLDSAILAPAPGKIQWRREREYRMRHCPFKEPAGYIVGIFVPVPQDGNFP